MTVDTASNANGNGHAHEHHPGAGGIMSRDRDDLNLTNATNRNGPNGDPEAVGYEVPNIPMGTKRKVRVVTIGGGASGINMAYQIWQHMENVEHVAYEKSDGLGGTWLDNRWVLDLDVGTGLDRQVAMAQWPDEPPRLGTAAPGYISRAPNDLGLCSRRADSSYPGCACDVPSHSYQFSFHPHTGWTHFYSGSKEICDYMNSIVDTYGLRDQFKTSHEVVNARWDDAAAQWVVTVKGPDGEFEDRCDFLINGSGILKYV